MNAIDEARRVFAECEAELARRTLLGFTRYINPDYQANWHHALIARLLDGVLAGTTKRLMLFMPPQHGKTELASRHLVPLALGRNPDLPVVFGTYNADRAKEISADVQRVMDSQAYATLFPGTRLGSAKDTEVRQAAKFHVVGRRGVYQAAGVGQGISGKSMLLGIIDDPYRNRADAESEAYRKEVWNWYVADFSPRQMGDDAAIILIQTRWHEDDLAGHLLRLAVEYPQAPQWTVVSLAAICDELRPDDPRQLGDPLWPTRFSLKWLEGERAIKGVYDWCTPAETPILMGDFTVKPVSQVIPGDMVIGFVKSPSPHGRRVLVRTTVMATGRRRAYVCDLLMESGRRVRCTKDHRWMTGRWATGRNLYAPASIGSKLHFAVEPFDTCSDEERLLWAYLAGIVDGEGSVERSALVLAQGLGRNRPVYDEMRRVCTALGLTFKEHVKPHSQRNKKWQDAGTIVLHDVGTIYRKLIRFTNSAKKQQMLQALTATGAGRFDRGKDRVLDIKVGDVEDVFSLQTETGNYVAWGYLSSNSSLYQQRPVPPGGAMGNRTWFKIGPRRGGIIRQCRAWDIAGTKATPGRDPDWTVGTLVGQHADGTWSVLNVKRLRGTPYEVDLAIKQAAVEDGTRTLIREERVGLAGKVVEAAHVKLLAGYDYAAVGIGQADKPTRWRPFLVQAEAGNVHVVEAGWNAAWLDELAMVPYGRHDDQADSVALAFNELTSVKEYGATFAAILPGVPQTVSGPKYGSWQDTYYRR